MAPDFYDSTHTSIPSMRSNVYSTILQLSHHLIRRVESETKKQRIKRIAKEKMYASWDTHNKKNMTIVQQKQICKPAHRISFMGRKK